MNRHRVYEIIDSERDHQDRKWGTIVNHPHEVAGYLTLIRTHSQDADEAWSGSPNDESALEEVRKIAAIAVACMEQHGARPRHKHYEAPVNMRSNDRLLDGA